MPGASIEERSDVQDDPYLIGMVRRWGFAP